MRLLGNWSAAGTHEYKYTSVDKLLIESYLDGVIIGLAGFCIRLVWHEPCLQQVLVKTIPKSSNWGVICKEGGGKRIQKIAVEGTECDRAKEGGKTARQTNEEAKRNYSFFHFPATFGIKSMYWDPGWIFLFGFYLCPLYIGSTFPLIFPFCLPFPWCAHISMSLMALLKVYTAFMVVPICRTSHRDDGRQPTLILISLRKWLFSRGSLKSTWSQFHSTLFYLIGNYTDI